MAWLIGIAVLLFIIVKWPVVIVVLVASVIGLVIYAANNSSSIQQSIAAKQAGSRRPSGAKGGGRITASYLYQRKLDIIEESIKIALTSKKPDTAKSRYDLAMKMHRELLEDGLPAGLRARLDETMGEFGRSFPITCISNEVDGLLEKAAKLKTPAGKRKHLVAAQARIDAALVGAPEDLALQQLRGRVQEQMDALR